MPPAAPGFLLGMSFTRWGPVYGMNGDAACYRSSVELAVEHDLKTIAFPSISTGAFGYLKHEAAPVVIHALAPLVVRFSEIEIRLVFFSAADAQVFLKHAL